MSLATPDGYGAAFLPLEQDVPGPGWYVCDEAGRRSPLGPALGRWCGLVDPVDLALLARADGAVLDVGCGPGRLVAELARQGQSALGVDVAAAAVRLTTRAGGAAIRRSVFDPLPGEGRWGAVLLVDGNVGIGGDPVALLARLAALLAPSGRAVVEVEAPGGPSGVERVRLEGDGAVSSWFPWARLSVDDVGAVARAAGLAARDVWSGGERWFAELVPGGRA